MTSIKPICSNIFCVRYLAVAGVGLALVLVSLVCATNARADINLDSLLAETVGGPEAVDSLRSFDSYYAAGDLLLNGQPGEFKIWYQSPNLLRHEMDFNQFSIIQSYDGTTAWKQDVNGGKSELSGFERRDLLRELYLYSYAYLIDGRVPGSREYKGITTLDSRTVHEVWFYPFDTDTIRVFIDAASGRMVLSETRLDNYTTRTYHENYRQIHGITTAFRIRSVVEGIQMEAQLSIREMNFGADIDRAMFDVAERPDRPPEFRFPPGATAVTVPVEYVQGQLQVVARVNGTVAARFILDSGSGTGLFDRAFSAQARLPVVGSLPFRGVAEQNQIEMVRADSIQLGGLTLFSLLGGSPSLKHIDLHGGDPAFGGLFGYDFFSRFPVEIDFSQKEMTIYHPDRATLPTGGLTVPFEFTMQVPIVPATIGDLSGEFIIDLGNPYNLIVHPHFAADERLQDYLKAGGGAGYLQGVGGTVYVTRSTIAELSLGPVAFEDVEAVFPQGESGLVASVEVAGNIGTGLLDEYRILFDYPGKRLIFFPPEK